MNPYPRLNKLLLVSGLIWWLGLGILQASPLSDTMPEPVLTHVLFNEGAPATGEKKVLDTNTLQHHDDNRLINPATE